MNPIRIRKHVDSETLHLPELREMIGKTVEIIVREETPGSCSGTETMETFLALAPKEQPVDPKEIAAMLKDPEYKDLWAFLEVAGQDIIDVDAIVKLRAASIV